MTSPAHPTQPGLPGSRSAIAALAAIAAATLMAALDERIVVTAMPRIVADLHGLEQYTGVFTGFMVASTAAIPIFGKLSDLYGRKRLMLIGIGIFVLGSALCGAATGLDQLIVFRAIQGIGAGSTEALAFSAIADLFPPERRGRITGGMGMVYGLAGALGPPLGGLMTDTLGWRSVFYLSVPVGLAAAGVLLFAFPPPRGALAEPEGRPPIDGWGMVTLIGWVVPLLMALTWGGREHAWGSPLILALFVGAAVMLGLFLRAERRAAAPVIPLGLLQEPFLITCAIVVVLFVVGGFGPLLFLPLFIQGVLGASATRCGTLMLPMIAAMMLSSALAGQLVSRVGSRVLSVGCLALMAVAMVLLALMGMGTSELEVAAKMALLGLALGATIPVFISSVQNAVEASQVGTATSMLQFLQTVASALGAAMLGSVMANRLGPAQDAAPQALALALQQVFAIAAALLVVGALLALRLHPRTHPSQALVTPPLPGGE